MSNTVVMRGSGMPPREPDALCDGCGARGTVGRAMRTDAHGAPLEVHRFCARCWPERSAQLEARWAEENRLAHETWLRSFGAMPQPPARGAAFESATWHSALRFVREVNRALRGSDPPSRDDLAQIAAELKANASGREGAMPLDVEAFIQSYDAPAR